MTPDLTLFLMLWGALVFASLCIQWQRRRLQKDGPRMALRRFRLDQERLRNQMIRHADKIFMRMLHG